MLEAERPSEDVVCGLVVTAGRLSIVGGCVNTQKPPAKSKELINPGWIRKDLNFCDV